MSMSTLWAVSRFYNADRLSSNLITCITQDRQGYIWIGTEYGLNRFDGVHFDQFYADDRSEGPLLGNHILRLLKDSQGELWILFRNGLQRYDENTRTFQTVRFDSNEEMLLSDIIQCQDGSLLVLTPAKGLWMVHPETMTATQDATLSRWKLPASSHKVLEDDKARLWICSNNHGFMLIDRKTGKSKTYDESTLGSKGTSAVGQDAHGRILVLSRKHILLFNEETLQLEPLITFDRKLSARHLFRTPQGELLVGTFGRGIYRVDVPERELMPMYEEETAALVSGEPKVNALMVDALQNVWIGCFQQGLVCLSSQQMPFSFRSLTDINTENEGQLTTLFSDRQGRVYFGYEKGGIVSLDDHGRQAGQWLAPHTVISGVDDGHNWLWIGTYNNGVYRMNLQTHEVKWMEALTGERIKSITFDRQGNAYLAVFNKGLRSYISDGSQERTLAKGKLQLHNPYINVLMTDSKGMIWIGHYYGFDLYDPTSDRLQEVTMDTTLRKSTIYAISETKDGLIWLGTNHGLYGYDRQKKVWEHYSKTEGLPNEIVCGIIETEDGSLWLSTYRGLSQMNRTTGQFTNYYKGGGLQEMSYSRGIYLHSAGGYMMFGNDNGITYFRPKDVKPAEFLRSIALTTLLIGNLQQTVMDNQITLSHLDNTFTLRFSTMDFRDPDNIIYEYRFSDEPKDVWHQTTPGEAEITFTHLSVGRHQLEVRAIDNGLRSEATKIDIRITPPWYRSWWAYTLYIVILGGIALMLWLNWRHKQLAETNEEKIKFFVDVSHELRSPLTLIKSPLETLLGQQHDTQTQRALRNISRNTDRLLSLINEILSIRKIEKGQMRLHYAETPMTTFLADICHNYDYLAEKRKIQLTFQSEDESLLAWVDHEHFDKVINNLLTNAMKYVNDKGQIDVLLRKTTDGKSGQGYAEMVVRDDGTGIDEQQLQHVFERFYQASARPQSGQMGYGIGLNLAYKVVRLHGGTIEAHNRTDVEHGSEFIVRMPLGNDHLPKDQLVDADYFVTKEERLTAPVDNYIDEKHRSSRKKTTNRVVVVDDDAEMRNFLSTELGFTYHVAAYADGQQAWGAINETLPDLVISDVVMPVMDGFELLHRIKNNTKTSHIPVILLTTKTEHQSRMEGLEEGADAYMDKPFNLEELEARAAGLIANRLRMKGKFSGNQEQEGVVKPIELKGNDAQLMERIMANINERLSDEDFNVEALAEAVGLSRVQLHRRVKEITGISVGEFIRNLRLQQAAKLLAKGDVTVSQVTYAIGMANPTHFTTAFKKYFGVTPTEYMNKHKEQADS